ncbi:MAG: competence/damage-inducible protein A [Sphingobacteriales bacterium]|nr:competence/damage-inducible protein A [Sphingobacteriales bacterium]
MNCTLLTIGDEILIGQIVDTNSAWMAKQLNAIGIRVAEIISLSDSQQHIVEGLDRALAQSDIVLITGGLGPTKDDITKNVLADYFQSDLTFYPHIYAQLEEYLKRRGIAVVDAIHQMAMLPTKCQVIQNQKGMAAAMWFEQAGKVVVSMPGVPYEMIHFMEQSVLPMLADRFKLPAIYHHTLQCAGLGESVIAQKIEAIEDALPPHIKLAYLPSLGVVRLRLSASGDNYNALKADVLPIVEQIKNALTTKYLFAEGDETLPQTIAKLLLAKNATLATAESCTGGLIAHKITAIAGASSYFMGGVVTYSNQLKTQLLGVKPTTLDQYGAVSEQTVTEMAQGTIERLGVDYSIAVSGIAGPGGGTPDKPVGTIWVAVASKNKTRSKLFNYGRPHRDVNIELAANMALNELRKLLLDLEQ